MHKLTSQSALEFLSTYSWALLVIGVFVTVTIILSFTATPQFYLPTTCYISSAFQCVESLLSGSGVGASQYIVQFTNKLGATIYLRGNSFGVAFSSIGANTMLTWNGICSPSLLPNGGQAVCTANLPITATAGSSYTTYISLRYNICKGAASSTCTNAVYTTTGIAQQIATPAQSTVLHTVTLFTTANLGYIAFENVAYPSNTAISTALKSASVFAQPPVGYFFQNWAGSGVSVADTASQNTVVTITSNGVLTASFFSTTSVSTSTTSSTSTSTSTTSTSTTSISTTSTSTSTTTSTSTSTTSTSTSTTTSTSTSTTSTSTSTIPLQSGSMTDDQGGDYWGGTPVVITASWSAGSAPYTVEFYAVPYGASNCAAGYFLAAQSTSGISNSYSIPAYAYTPGSAHPCQGIPGTLYSNYQPGTEPGYGFCAFITDSASEIIQTSVDSIGVC